MQSTEKKEPHHKVVFKEYHQHQVVFLPPSWEELIETHHPVRTVSQIVDRLDISAIEDKYKGGGAGSFHPRVMLKVLIYSYMKYL